MKGRAGAAVVVALALSLAAGPWAAGDLASAATATTTRKKAPASTKKSTKKATKPPDFDPRLPILGTRLREFPAGLGKESADRGCVFCHSVDMVAQQRLTEKQWTAEVTKMANWGADVPADKREELAAYLVKNFGPDAPPYEPVITRPVGK